MEIIFAYTDISFTEKQKEDIAKLYDQMASSGVIANITKAIPTGELEIISQGVKDSIEAVYKYQNSVYGILDTLRTDYDNLDLNAQTIVDKIGAAENIDLVRDIMNKLG